MVNTNYDTSLVSDMDILKKVCSVTTSIPVIHVFYGSFIILRERLKRSKCPGDCVYFTTLVVTIHYNERSVPDLRKLESYVYLKKAIMALLF